MPLPRRDGRRRASDDASDDASDARETTTARAEGLRFICRARFRSFGVGKGAVKFLQHVLSHLIFLPPSMPVYPVYSPKLPPLFHEPPPATASAAVQPTRAAGLPAGLPAAPAITVPTATASPAVFAHVRRRRHLRHVRDVPS